MLANLQHLQVDFAAVAQHLSDRRPRQQTAPRSWKLLTDSVVVGIKQILVAAVGGARFPLLSENESLEEPRRVRQVPSRRTGVGHRLNAAIFRFERLAKRLTELPNSSISL